MMEPQALNFLRENRVGVLSVLLKDGSPHGAAVHFAHEEDPLRFYFLTDKNYKKCEALLESGSVRASFVIGTDERSMQTFQLDGSVHMVSSPTELNNLKKVYFEKIPTAKEYENDPDSVYLEFVPTWWQFTDYNAKPEFRVSNQI